LLRRRIDLGFIIPPDFSAKIRRGDTAEVQTPSRRRHEQHGSDTNFLHGDHCWSVSTASSSASSIPRRLDYGEIDGRIRTWYNPNLDSQYFYVPGIVAFLVMLLSLLLTSMAIVREKEVGTMEQLIVTPLKPFELILGKTIPFILIAQAQMAMVIAFAIFWFSIPMVGNAVLLLGATCIFLLSTLGIGLFISTVSKTQQQAMMTNFFFILPFFMLSGFVFPISNMPVIIQWLTYLNPLQYFLVIIRGIFLNGSGIEILWPQFLSLAVLGGIVFTGAVNRFRKRLD
jgi:ABC-2 type transport system permease protein